MAAIAEHFDFPTRPRALRHLFPRMCKILDTLLHARATDLRYALKIAVPIKLLDERIATRLRGRGVYDFATDRSLNINNVDATRIPRTPGGTGPAKSHRGEKQIGEKNCRA